MRYGDARQVAALLNDMFVGSSSSGLDAPKNQLTPGGGMVASSATQQSVGSSQQGTNPTPAAGGVQQSSAAAPASFNSRFGGPQVAGPPTWASNTPVAAGSAGSAGSATPLLPNVRISADAVNNDLLIYASQDSYGIIKRALDQIDRPQLQVAIDATIAEVTLNDNLQYGVQFFLKSSNVGAPADTGSLINTAANAALSRVLPGFNFLVGTEAQPQVILNALHSITDVKILSNPSLVVLDNGIANSTGRQFNSDHNAIRPIRDSTGCTGRE